MHAFLLAIGVDEATAAHDAEGIEHHVSPKTLKCLQNVITRLKSSTK
ncbi:MAG: iron dependent repressor, metal binding and dimerization domain protein [Rhodopirellula sp. JB055]